ncbi:MAG: YrdB family protein [Caldilineaceae bacterium]|nr:YrdB family protein [Caldilineaceae bacterium]
MQKVDIDRPVHRNKREHMELIKLGNMGLRFALELCLLLIFSYWGWRTGETTLTKALLGMGGPVLVAAVWGVLLAPKSATRLPAPWLFLLEIGLFGLAVWALARTDRTNLAAAFGGIYLLNKVLMLLWRQ